MLNSERYLRALPDLSEDDGAPDACNAGRKYFSVYPFGYLHPCVDTPAVGRILSDDITVIRSAASLAAVQSCPGCWYCFRGEADSTLSPGGCLDKVGLGIMIMWCNSTRKDAGVRTPPRWGRRPRPRSLGDRRGATG